MLFSSFSFLFWFLPLTLLLYFLPALLPFLPIHRLAWQNAVLTVASLFFYAWGEPLYVLLLLGTVLFNAALAARMPKSPRPRRLLLAAVAADIALLLLFKYPPLVGLPAPHLPLGISFYTFQALSYVADVYTGRARPAQGTLTVLLYVALFPQLIAGPIVRYTDVEHALSHRHHTLYGAACGARRFAAGLAKKLLLANPAGALFVTFAASGAHSAIAALLALIGYTFQIYFDFSGYSDMAIGLGRILGFRFPENFNYPYTAVSVTDFWRRWHITLSAFFREYVYFPLGGSRRGNARTVLNLLAVWALTGLWHGASVNFLLWGLYYFLLLVLEKFVLRRLPFKPPRAIARTLTLLTTLGGWLLFAFDGSAPALTLSALPGFVATLFGARGLSSGVDVYELLRHLPFLSLCALGATPLPRRLFCRITSRKRHALVRTALPMLALVLCIAALSGSGYNPFLYFRF